MRKVDVVKIRWEQDRNFAVKFGRSLVKMMMENYHEPTRAGTPKGERIGFSRKKKRAALLMILYPYGLGLKEIAKIASVPPGVLRIWRTEAAFKEAESEACNTVREIFSKINDIASVREKIQLATVEDARIHELLKKLPLGIEGIDQDGMRYPLLKLLPFFNPLSANPVFQTIAERIQLSIPGYVDVALLLTKVPQPKDEKSLRTLKARPEVKALIRALIESWIELISDPEARKEAGPERIRDTAETLKTFIFQELDL